MNINEFYKWGREYLAQSEETKHLSFEEGTVNSDVLLKVFTALSFQLQLDIDKVRLGQSLENYDLMDPEQMEALVANVFLERRAGAKSRVTQTLYFRRQVDLTIGPETIFYSKDGKAFVVDGIAVFKAFQMRRELIDTTEYYAVDVSIEAVDDGVENDIPANEITIISTNPEGFVFTTNKAASIGGYDYETNAELKTRGERAIATRDNISDNSIYTVFNQEFGDILDLYSVGYLHPDMQRDVLRASGCWMHHNGGMTDTYVKMALEDVVKTVKLVDNKYFRVRGFVKDSDKFWRVYAASLYASVDYDRFPLMADTDSETCVPGPVVYGLEVKKSDLVLPYVMHIADFTERFSIRENIDVMIDGLHYWVKPTLTFIAEFGPNYVLPVGTVFTTADGRTYTMTESQTIADTSSPFTFTTPIYADKVGVTENVGLDELYLQAIADISVTHDAAGYTDLLLDGVVDVSYKTHPRLYEYQQFAHLPNQTPIVNDLLFKNFTPVIIEEIVIAYTERDLDPVVTRNAQKTIRDYIFNWKSGEPIYLSHLVMEVAKNTGILFPEIGSQEFLTSKTGDIIDENYDDSAVHDIVSSPVYVRYRQYNADGTEIVRETSTQISAIINNEVQSSEHTVRYYVADSESDDYDTIIKLENPLREKKLDPTYGGIR